MKMKIEMKLADEKKLIELEGKSGNAVVMTIGTEEILLTPSEVKRLAAALKVA